METQTLWSIGVTLLVVSVFVIFKEVKSDTQEKPLSSSLKLIASILILIAMFQDDLAWYDYLAVVLFIGGSIMDTLYLVKYFRKRR